MANKIHHFLRQRRAQKEIFLSTQLLFLFYSELLALSLLMLLVFGADDHDFSVSFDYSAFVAHGLNRRSDFHFFYPPIT